MGSTFLPESISESPIGDSAQDDVNDVLHHDIDFVLEGHAT